LIGRHCRIYSPGRTADRDVTFCLFNIGYDCIFAFSNGALIYTYISPFSFFTSPNLIHSFELFRVDELLVTQTVRPCPCWTRKPSRLSADLLTVNYCSEHGAFQCVQSCYVLYIPFNYLWVATVSPKPCLV
jgi:hypothetical protein